MLDIGWSELVLIGVAALIFVGPKDLPRMFFALGKMTAKARSMAREFQRAMDDAAKNSGLDDIKKDINAVKTGVTAATNPGALGINALEDAARKFEKWDPKTVLKPAASAVVTPAAATGAELGAETKALAEKRAADAAAARAKAHELQAKAAETASATFAARAKADAEAVAAKAAATPAVAEAPKVPKARKPKVAAEPVSAVAEVTPARKPPVRRKKSEA